MIAMLPIVLALAAAQQTAAARTPAPAPAMVEVPVLTRTVERGQPVSASDFTIEPRPAIAARDAIAASAAGGLEARRRLMAGSVVREGDLAHPQAIRRGEPVSIVYRVGALAITTQGRALTGGAVGDPVRVVSLATNHTLDGTVEQAGTVRLAGQ
jgi:flagellar basal body P-ring formation protein FlgA